MVLFGFGTSLFFFLFFRNNHFGTKVKQACSTAWVVSLLEPIWTTKNHHSISVNQFPSLITYHSFFHTHLTTSLLFSSLNFFILFMGPTPASRYIFFFSVPNSPKLIFKKKLKKKKKRTANANLGKKKKVKRWSKVAAVGPLCMFNYNIAIEL